MTTTPADLDALAALEQAATPAPWAHEHEGGHIVHGPDGTVAEAIYAPDAALIAAMRNALPALLGELAEAREEEERYRQEARDSATQAGRAIRERDAAREELDKTRAELDDAQARINRTLAALTNPMWRGLLDDDVAKLVDETGALLRADANPATTAEPAVREVTLAEAAQQARLNLIEAEQRRIAQAQPDDAEQDNESLFESHRLADGTMPDTIPVTDPEQDAPDGATVDGYTRQRDTWVKSAEPAAS